MNLFDVPQPVQHPEKGVTDWEVRIHPQGRRGFLLRTYPSQLPPSNGSRYDDGEDPEPQQVSGHAEHIQLPVNVLLHLGGTDGIIHVPGTPSGVLHGSMDDHPEEDASAHDEIAEEEAARLGNAERSQWWSGGLTAYGSPAQGGKPVERGEGGEGERARQERRALCPV